MNSAAQPVPTVLRVVQQLELYLIKLAPICIQAFFSHRGIECRLQSTTGHTVNNSDHLPHCIHTYHLFADIDAGPMLAGERQVGGKDDQFQRALHIGTVSKTPYSEEDASLKHRSAAAYHAIHL